MSGFFLDSIDVHGGSSAVSRPREAEDHEDGTARLEVEFPGTGMAALETTNLADRSTPPALKGRGGPCPSAAGRGGGPEA